MSSVEYAKSSSALCKSPYCEVASRKIMKGEVRFKVDGLGFTHMKCLSRTQAACVGGLDNLDGYNTLKSNDQLAVQKIFKHLRVVQSDLVEPKIEHIKSFLTILQSVLTSASCALDIALSSSQHDHSHATEQLVGELRSICRDSDFKRPDQTHEDGSAGSSSSSQHHQQQQTPSTGSHSESSRRRSMSTLSSANTVPSIAEETAGAVNYTPGVDADLSGHTVVTQDGSVMGSTTVETSGEENATITISSFSLASVPYSIATAAATPSVVSVETSSQQPSEAPAPHSPYRTSRTRTVNVAAQNTMLPAAATSESAAALSLLGRKKQAQSRGQAQVQAAIEQKQGASKVTEGASSRLAAGGRRIITSPTDTLRAAMQASRANQSEQQQQLSESLPQRKFKPEAAGEPTSFSPTADNLRQYLREQTRAKRDSLSRSYPRFKGTTVSQQELSAAAEGSTSAGRSSFAGGAAASRVNSIATVLPKTGVAPATATVVTTVGSGSKRRQSGGKATSFKGGSSSGSSGSGSAAVVTASSAVICAATTTATVITQHSSTLAAQAPQPVLEPPQACS